MLTKEQFAKSIVQNFEINISEDNKPFKESDVMKSSSLAVAAEFLGLLKTQEYKDYAASRAGTIAMYWDSTTKQTYFLSVRDVLSLLPDRIEE